jgi:valyl-tRNA synthetase
MTAPFPEPFGGMIDAAVEARFGLVTSVIREIRNIRAQYGIPPGKEIRAIVTSRDAQSSLGIVGESREMVTRLARLEAIEVAPRLEKPQGAALAVVKDIEVYVPLAGLIDLEAEKKRVLSRLEKVERQLAGVRAKLAAAGFAERAPAEVIAKTRETEAELLRQAESLRASARDLA